MATTLPQEDINFLRLAGLLQKIAPRAVRRCFDREFHPNQLKQFLSKNRRKIDDMKFKKRVITQAEYDLLYPRSSSAVSSGSFDVSLMVCLLKNFSDLDIQDQLPPETIHTAAEDISRIKFYRNYIAHSDSGKVTESMFTVIWKCVVEAIIRLLPELKPDIDALMSSSLTNVGEIKHVIHVRLEKELENTNQHMSAINQKLEKLEIKKNNVREIRHRVLKEWRESDKKYVSTSASTSIFKSLQHNRGVIITGSPGCGKSAAARHVSLKLEKERYEIIPCDDPSEILNHFTSEKILVFVYDDVCGKFALNQQKADSWDHNDDQLSILIETNQNESETDSSSCKIKFIITCRENIYYHRAFPKLNCLSLIQCSFSTNCKISQDEMKNIALAYVSEETVNDIQSMYLFDFFPLICALYCKKKNRDPRFFTHPVEIIEKEISVMKIKSESSFLCLSLLVLRNNNISKADLRSGDVEQIVKDICWDCDIEAVISMVSIQKSFECFNDIYIIEAEEKYTAIHDKMFDIIAAAIAPSIMKCLIKYGDIGFLTNRIQLLSLGKSSLPFAVCIPQELERQYLKRIYKEAMRGKYWEVFGGIQAENKTYRKLILSFLKEQDTCQQTAYVTDDDGATPLFVSSSLGYLDFVQYFIVTCHHLIDVKDKEGRSPFYVACKSGHTAVVKYLVKYYEDVNAEMSSKTTALSAACLNGHTEVVQVLLDNNADINRTNDLNQNALYCACLNGKVHLASLLFRAYNTDTTIKDNHELTTLSPECQKENAQTLKQVKEFCRHVNQQSDGGWTPLFAACSKGNYETVKYLLDFNSQTLNEYVDTSTKDNDGSSILHVACNYGQTEIVKLLIEVGLKQNDTTNKGCTPLFLACLNGHHETVKYLLNLNTQQLNNGVDATIKNEIGWSVLHAACSNGNADIVKLLIDIGINVNDRTKVGFTPLFLACFHGYYEIVKILLNLNCCVDLTMDNDLGCNIDETDNDSATPLGQYDTVKNLLDLKGKQIENQVYITIENKYGWSALHAACSNGHTKVVKLLLDVGYNLDDTNNDGVTPFCLACHNGQYDTVKYLLDLKGKLLENQVYTTTRNKYGWSALHRACFSGQTDVAKLLIDAGMNINATLNSGETPLYLACVNGHYNTMIFLLDLNGQTLNSRVDTMTKNPKGLSLFHVACFQGHTEIVKLLIEVGLNVNDTSNEGFTPLYLACEKGHYDTVKLLLDLNCQTLNSCVDTSIKDNNGGSILHLACYYGHTKIAKLLINVGMNVNDTTDEGCTPLYLACHHGQYDTVKILLDLNGKTLNSRVDTTIEDMYGNSALRAAYSNGHKEVVKLVQGNTRTYFCVIL